MKHRNGYGGTQILLHWIIAALILFNYIYSDGMGQALDARLKGAAAANPEINPAIHVWVGVAVLVLCALRLIVRTVRGAPEPGGTGMVQMAARWGHRLLYLLMFLVPLAGGITPNRDEAGWRLGRSLQDADALEAAAQDLRALGAQAVLLKGGHLPGDWVVDVLSMPGAPQAHKLQSPRIATHNGHGTGCTLSSAIAAHLALGLPLQQAVEQARSYILGAIAAGADVTTGRGHGPLNHGYAPIAQRVFENS